MSCCRKLLLWSLVGVTAAMLFLGGAFRLAETHSPPVTPNSECPAFEGSTCTDCIRQVSLPLAGPYYSAVPNSLRRRMSQLTVPPVSAWVNAFYGHRVRACIQRR